MSDTDTSSDSEQENNSHQDRDLSPEEMDKLVQLQDITGMEDLQICRALLESNGWDLEATAREQLNLPHSSQDNQRPPDKPIAPHTQAPEVVPIRQGVNGPMEHRAAGGRGGVVVNRGFFSWTLYMLSLPLRWPLNIAYKAMTGIFQFVASLFGFGPSNSRPIRFWPPTTPFDPHLDVLRFRESFNEEFGFQHPEFFSGTYAQVLEKAKKDLQFLLVYLHSQNHPDTNRFCRTTLASTQLMNFVIEHNLLVWGCSVESGEGCRVSQALRESRYPFLAVVVLRQNRMMIVGRFEGFMSSEDLLPNLMQIIRDNEAYIVAARAERQERQINQQIRLEQDAALQESLRQDQEKERKKREEVERKEREQAEERRLREETDRKKETIRKLKIDLADRIPDEPDSANPETVRILIKFPGGQRLERRFLKQDSLKSLFYFVFCHPDSPDEFEITTNFPRKVVPCRPEDLNQLDQFEANTFQEEGFNQSTILFVNDLDA